jgi:hypothetical protein
MVGGFRLGVELEKGFYNKFLTNIKQEINKKLISVSAKAVPRIKSKLQTIVLQRITSSPEYAAIVGSGFRGELGLPDAGARVNAVVNQWAQNISVTFVPQKSAGQLGLINIGIIQDDYSDVLSLAEAELTYSGARGQKTLRWLDWLITRGSSIIVSDYEYKIDSRSSRSRTGLGIMVKRRGGWKIPAQLAGTENDNFATRALEGIEGEIQTIIRQELTKVL